MRKSIIVLSLGLLAAAAMSAPAAGGAVPHVRHVPKALRLAPTDPSAPGSDATPSGTLRFGFRHGQMVCFGRFAHLDPGAQYQFQWGAQGTTPTSFTANRRGCARFRTTTVPTDPAAGQAQALVTNTDLGAPILYCDWDAMMFGRTQPDPTTPPPATTPQGGSSTWGGMGCGWR
jgi:hypothetical protein